MVPDQMTFFNFIFFSLNRSLMDSVAYTSCRLLLLSLLHFFIFKDCSFFLTENWINCVYSSTAVHAFMPYRFCVYTYCSHKITFGAAYACRNGYFYRNGRKVGGNNNKNLVIKGTIGGKWKLEAFYDFWDFF